MMGSSPSQANRLGSVFFACCRGTRAAVRQCLATLIPFSCRALAAPSCHLALALREPSAFADSCLRATSRSAVAKVYQSNAIDIFERNSRAICTHTDIQLRDIGVLGVGEGSRASLPGPFSIAAAAAKVLVPSCCGEVVRVVQTAPARCCWGSFGGLFVSRQQARPC
jgi:hypothetical protein